MQMETVITRVALNAGAESDWDAAMRDRMAAAEASDGWVGARRCRLIYKSVRAYLTRVTELRAAGASLNSGSISYGLVGVGEEHVLAGPRARAEGDGVAHVGPVGDYAAAVVGGDAAVVAQELRRVREVGIHG